MGYTHYFEHTAVTEEVWGKILTDCRKLKKKLPSRSLSAGGYCKDQELVIGDGGGEKKLRVFGSKKQIIFNGFPDEMAHETFSLFRDGSDGFEFCKTARKPYDLLVCACLVVYHYHSQETVKLGSDGDMEDWAPAIDFVSNVLGPKYAMKFKIEVTL